jgi:signal transduction histidine kinase
MQVPLGSDLSFLPGDGEMAARIRSFDWEHHALGPPDRWPQSLKIVIRIMLTSRYAMWMGWGKELYFFCNDAYLPTLGIKREWFLGASARKVWAEIWPEIGPRAESVVQTGKATWDEGLLLFLERSGYSEETYHTFSYSPVPNDDSSIGGMLCVVTEETERIIGARRLAALRDIAAELDNTRMETQVFDTVGRLLCKHNKDLPFGLIYLFDSEVKWARLACCPPTDVAGDIAPAQINISNPNSIWPLHHALTKTGAVLIDDLSRRFTALPLTAWDRPPKEAAIVPLMQQGQERPVGVFVAGLNPYRPFDAAYRGFIDLLTGQIGAALSNARAYEEERKRAEALAELDRAKTAFFSNVSHEFRTPLTLMLGPLEDELSKTSGPRENLELVHRSSLRLLKLVNTLLDFSRIEAGRMDAAFEPVDLATYTRDLASVFRSAVEKAGLRYVVDCPPLPEPVYVDPGLWEKIVLNLISNAFKFTFEGQITVTLRLKGNQVEFSVSDTGVGIPEAELPKIFERFHRVRGTQSRSYEGTGIGLALVQELVKLHGGDIHARSIQGKGTAFTITLPAGATHLSPNQIVATSRHMTATPGAAAFVEEALRWSPDLLPSEQNPPPADRPSSGEGRSRILLADDNADMRNYIRRLLAKDYEVEAVADGKAALETILANPPDLILTDVMMPNVDGFGLLHHLRADASTRSIPCIMLSARAGEEARVEGLDAGADGYLTKPFSGRELLARVRSQLAMACLRRESYLRERELRAQIEAHAQDLEKTVARRTANLREMVVELEHFSYAIAHDMRAPLRAMQSFATILEEESVNNQPPNIEYVKRIKTASTRLDQLITDSLNFSKTLRQDMPTSPVDLSDLVVGLIETYPNLQPDKAVIRIDPNLPTVFGNEAGLTQCFSNLLGNAVKFARADTKPEIRIRAEVMPRDENSVSPAIVRIWVEDNGIGIPEDSLERIFGMFQRASKGYEGTGIGLAIVRKVVERMGGRVGVESELDIGSRFWVELPLASR